MLRTLLALVLLVPLACLILLFAIANRGWISVSLDPFAAEDPALSVSLPLFFVVLISLMGGVILGGVATWLGQAKWRRAARRHRAELRRARGEAAFKEPRADFENRPTRSHSTALIGGYGRPPAA
jgi:uncharacterized integral membrane protein